VATLHDAARYGRHRADNNCSVWGRDSETQIKLFYEFERRKELDGGAVVEECYYAMKKRLSAKSRGRRRCECNFRSSECQDVQDWSQGTTEAELRKYHDAVRVSIASMSKYPWFVSSRGASLDPGTAKNHSTNVLSESEIIFSLILPLLAAAWKRRKSFTVVRSGASTFFLRTRFRIAASSGMGSHFWKASSFASSWCQLKFCVNIHRLRDGDKAPS